MKEKDKKKAKWPVLHVPMVLGAVAIAYNHPEVKDQLKLDGATLADIYLGKITKWNAPQIQKLNPEAKLPAKRYSSSTSCRRFRYDKELR